MPCTICQARKYLHQRRKLLDRERGPVPLAVAAVLGAAASTEDHAWVLPPRVAARLGVPPQSFAGQEIWAGCRWTLELARSIATHTGLPEPDLWRAVVAVESPDLVPVLDRLAEEFPMVPEDRPPLPAPMERTGAVVRKISAVGWMAGRVGVAVLRARGALRGIIPLSA